MSRLVLVVPPIPVADNRIQLSDKTLSGLVAFNERWPGPVEVVARALGAEPSENLGSNWLDCDATPVPVHLGDPLALISALRPDIVQSPLTLVDQPAGRSGVPVVVVAENPALERLRYAITTVASRQVPRMALGAGRQHLALRHLVRDAQAVACNGWAAWESFRPQGSRHLTAPLLFFDSRLRENHVAEALGLEAGPAGARPPGNVTRLAFSGRFHPAKGVQAALEAALLLEQRGVPHHLTLIGAGPLEETLRERAGATVDFMSPMAFDPTWVAFVRASVDLMVLPHVQGDPSGTYLEAAGLGVPIVGFRNRALSDHVRNIGLGWTVRRGDVGALAAKIEDLTLRPDDVHAAGSRGMRFMREHSMEREFDRRVDHLLATLNSEAKR